MAQPIAFLRSLQIQSRVIGALLLREIITRYGRANVGFVWLFFEPMMFTLGVTAIWSFSKLGGHVTSIPIVAFSLTGYSPVLLWRNCASRASNAIPTNLGLLYHRNVRVLDLMISRNLLEISGATISFIVLDLTFVYFGLIEWPVDVAKMILAWFLLAWFGASLALVIGAMSSYSDVVERLWHTVAYLLFPLSGALYMVDWLPKDFQSLALLLPIVSCIELLREGYFGVAVRAHYDLQYVVWFCSVLTLLGLFLMRDAGRRAEVR